MKTETPLTRPPWPAAVAALISFAALALSSGATIPPACLALGLLASYVFPARYENVTLTKWTLRILVMGSVIFSYLATTSKDTNAFLDMRYGYSAALAAASEIVLQFWRRQPTGGARAPLLVVLSALVFLAGCSTTDDVSHYLWYLAPAYFLFFTLALPAFRPQAPIPARLTLLPVLLALLLGGLTHAGVYIYRGDLNALGSHFLAGQHNSVSMGMSGQPLLGASFTLRDSFTRVLRIQHLGDDPYLRGMTFDIYSGHSWGPSLEQRAFTPYLPPAFPVAGDGSIHVVRLDDAGGLLFAPLHSAAIQPEGAHTLEWARGAGGPVRTVATDTDPLTYAIISKNDRDSRREEKPGGLQDAPPTPRERARDLALPPDIDRRVIAKAQEIGGHVSKTQDKIEAVQRFLLRNNSYSLTTDPGSGEPISNFILLRKSAHCEYFASAAVILLRALHVPTRYVSGYFAHETWGKGWTLVRQRDAHAWAESWVEGSGWVTVDATPGNGRPNQLAGPIPFWWRLWEGMQDLLGALRNWVTTASWLQLVSVFTLLVLGLLLPQLYRWWQRRRQSGSGFHYSQTDAALAALASRFEALLDRRGQPCPVGRTWREHLHVIAAEDNPLPLPSLETFVQEYGQARFGRNVNTEGIARLDAELRALEKEKA